jgi:hypothetical protein
MSKLVGCVAVLVLLAPLTSAGSKPAPARLAQATYVALGYDVGDRIMSEQEAIRSADRLMPGDRQALDSIRDLLEDWDRYVIVERPDQAELLVVVRKGRRLSIGGGAPIGRVTPDQVGRTGPGIRGELSSAGDMLSIYESNGGQAGMLLWRETRPNGLSASSPALFESFKSDVERIPKKP